MVYAGREGTEGRCTFFKLSFMVHCDVKNLGVSKSTFSNDRLL